MFAKRFPDHLQNLNVQIPKTANDQKTPSLTTTMKIFFGILLRICLVSGCIWYVSNDLDFGALLSTLSGFAPLLVLLSAVLILLTAVIPALRLRFLINDSVAFVTSFNAILFGLGINNILPAKLGELSKAYYLRQISGVPFTKGLGAIFWERFADLNAILLIGLVAIGGHDTPLYVLPLGCFVGLLWAMLLLNKRHPTIIKKYTGFIPFTKPRDLLREIFRHLEHPFSPTFLLLLAGHTAVSWMGFLGIQAFVLLYVAGLDLTLVQFLVVFTLSSLSFAIPSSPGALGLFEASIVLGLGLAGIDKSTALATALLLHMVQYVPTTLWSLGLMSVAKINPQSIRQESVQACASPGEGR